MSEVDKIDQQNAELTAQREAVMLKERAYVLAKLKADIKPYGIMTSDFNLKDPSVGITGWVSLKNTEKSGSLSQRIVLD